MVAAQIALLTSHRSKLFSQPGGYQPWKSGFATGAIARFGLRFGNSCPRQDRAEIEGELLFVTDRLIDFVGGQRRANVYGMAARTQGGLKILLRHKFLMTIDDRFAMGVIAHELAHVLCRHPLDGVLWTDSPKEAYLWAEAEANALAQAWGFSPPTLLTGYWATTEFYAMIVRKGPDFGPIQAPPHPETVRQSVRCAAEERTLRSSPLIQGCFEFAGCPVLVA